MKTNNPESLHSLGFFTRDHLFVADADDEEADELIENLLSIL